MAGPTVHVQARLGSTRLPGKVLFHLGERRVLAWVVHRCKCATAVGDVVVTIGDRPENEAIVEWCRRNELEYTMGPEDHLLERHLQAAEQLGSERIVRITGDCPFVPPEEIDRIIGEHEANDARYTTNVTGSMPIGTGVDVIDRSVLEELREQGETHPVNRLREEPDAWNTIYSDSSMWAEYSDVHVAVDTPEDYWSLIDAMEAVGPEPHSIVTWLESHDPVSVDPHETEE